MNGNGSGCSCSVSLACTALLGARPWRKEEAEQQTAADRPAEVGDRRSVADQQQAERQPAGQRREQGAEQADRRPADILTHQNGVIDADGGDQEQAKQAEQGQRLAQPTEAGQRSEGRQQRQADHSQCAAEAEGQAQQQQDGDGGQQFQFGGAELGGTEQRIEFADPIYQLHPRQALDQRLEFAAVAKPLQADQPGHTVCMSAQPQRSPGLARGAGQGLFQAGLVILLEREQLAVQRGRRNAQIEQRLPVLRQCALRGTQLLQLAVGGDQLAEGAVVTQLTVLHGLIQALAQRCLAFQQLLRTVGA